MKIYQIKYCFTSILLLCVFVGASQNTTRDLFSLDLSPELEKCRYYYGFDPNSDSLAFYANLEIEKYNDDSKERSFALAHYYKSMANVQRDSASYYSPLNRFIAILEGEDKHQAKVYAKISEANFYRLNSRFEDAINICEESKISLKKLGIDSLEEYQLLAFLNSVQSSCYYNLGKYEESLSSAIQARELSEKSNNALRLIRAYQNLSAVYGDLSSSEKKLGSSEDRESYKVEAEKYLNLAYQTAKEKNIKRLLSISAYNLAVYYAIQGNNRSADTLLNTVIEHCKKIKFTNLLFSALLVKSDVQLEMERRDSSLYFALEAERISGITNNDYQEIKSKYSLSNIYHDKLKLTEARNYAQDGLKVAQKIGNVKWQRMGFELLELIEKSAGNFRLALKYNENLQEIKDSLMSQQSMARINEIKEKYESDLKVLEIESLRNKTELQQIKIDKKNKLLILFLLLSFFLICVLYLILRQRILKAEVKELDAKQKLLRSQLNPHFLFNVLNSIQQSIYLEKEPEVIADLIAKFSRLTRRILQYTQEKFINLEEEILFLRDYMDLQQIRFDEPFNYSIEIEDDLVPGEILIPPMFTQAFVENSIEHGILHKREKGEIRLIFSKSGESLKMVLEDNGVGREKAEFLKRNKEHRSIATKLTLERLKILEKRFRSKASLVITDVTNRQNLVTGTQVTLHIPYFNI